MQVKCKSSGKLFKIYNKDLEFYSNFDVPAPTLSPEERSRRRMAYANLRNLYKRKCDGTGKDIISNYSSDKECKVLDIKYFYSDAWNQHADFREINFNKPFFEQFTDLLRTAPRPAVQRAPEFDENSDYTNHAGKNKNCYLIFDSDYNWDCFYGYSMNSSRNCMDSYRLDSCELCYECIDCTNCYSCNYVQDSQNCANSWFLKSCIGCNDCFACVNLRNKKYCFFNEQLTKPEYEKRLIEYLKKTTGNINKFRDSFLQYSDQFPQKNLQGVQNEDSFGNYLVKSKNAFYCFDSRELWDCRYVQQSFDDAKNCVDCTEVGDAVENCYETGYSGYSSYFLRFTSHSLGKSSNLTYCYFCPFSSDCFACVGLHHAQYCIFNKRYTKDDYNKLVPKIIQHMKSTKEWGEFFPIEHSPFAYNESHAFDFYPLSKDETLQQGLKWFDFKRNESKDPTAKLCSCGKEFKIIKQELEFYQKSNLPMPTFCFDCRHIKRMKKRGSRKLSKANCSSCEVEVFTNLNKSAKICCEKCFLEAQD
jgi:hypothetical protein